MHTAGVKCDIFHKQYKYTKGMYDDVEVDEEELEMEIDAVMP